MNHTILDIDKSTPSLFQLIFSPLTAINDTAEDFILNLHTTNIPSLSISVDDHHWQGALAKSPGGEITFDDWTVDFIVDEQYNNWFMLYKWLTWINNNKDIFTRDFPDYAVDARLILKNNWKQDIIVVKFINIWPSSLGDISLTSRSSEEYTECNVVFSYDRYEVEKIAS